MATPLLMTKVSIPPERPELVARPRLVERLDEALWRRLTLVSAPAGFGKTTLLTQWVHRQPVKTAWFSLDDDDNDLRRFLSYLAAALQTVFPGIGEGMQAALESAQVSSFEPLVVDLLNRATAGKEEIILVLDDYQIIDSELIHSALGYILEHQPDNFHLVISTRTDPPLPLARLRGRGQLNELRLVDLRFTPQEAAQFLKRVMGLDLSAQDVAALAERTEGWIAGLQMAALSMRGREDLEGFIRQFTGSHHYILDYLVEEVLKRQPEGVQAFLLQTAILDRLCASLCEAVVEPQVFSALGQVRPPGNDHQGSAGRLMLERLEQANLFVMPLDDRQEWYRYHQLFAQLLRQRLTQTHPHLLPQLHARASRWYEQNGQMSTAIEHALAARDFTRAADLVEAVAEATFMRSEIGSFQEWVSALPPEVVQSRPTLSVYLAWALLLAGNPLGVVESYLQAADRDTAQMRGKAAVLRAFVASFRGDESRAAEITRYAMEKLPEDDLFLRSALAWNEGISIVFEGDLEKGIESFDKAGRLAQRVGNKLIAVLAFSNIAEFRIMQGCLKQSQSLYLDALKLAVDDAGRTLPVAGVALIGLGELCREHNEFAASERYLLQGIELTDKWSRIAALDGYIALARLRHARQDFEGAHQAILNALAIARDFDAILFDDRFVLMHQARLWALQGNWFEVNHWLVESGLKPARGRAIPERRGEESVFVYLYLRSLEYLVLARFLIHENRGGEALELLERLSLEMEAEGRFGSLMEILVLKAVACQSLGDAPAAMDHMARALGHGEQEGYARLFLDEGLPVEKLLREAVARQIFPEYATKLLKASGKKVALVGRPELIEQLSERELEVLSHLASGLSNQEIARQMVVATSTVKTHVHHIFRKLGVSSRTQALARARQIYLLD